MTAVGDARITPWSGCRVCGGRLQSVLDLGPIAVSGFPEPDAPDPITAPLDWCRCVGCGLVQLRHAVDPAYLYGGMYWYRSGVNETMVAELQDVVAYARAFVSDPRAVLDIGANDGTLLAAYAPAVGRAQRERWGALRIGVEPSASLHAALLEHADLILPETWPPPAPLAATATVDIVTSIACVYDANDPITFVRAIAEVLADGGVWIVQFQDLAQMVARTAFDNICHEHVTYPALRDLVAWVRPYGLEVVDAQRRAINGGSLRVAVRWAGVQASTPAVEALLAEEARALSTVALERFAHRVRERQASIQDLLHGLRDAGQTIDLYAASTKANTLLQVCGIDHTWIRWAWERTPEKVGRVTAGSRIPIVSEATGRQDPPDVLFLGAWQFAEAFVRREHLFLATGGLMIQPLPEVQTILAKTRLTRAQLEGQ